MLDDYNNQNNWLQKNAEQMASFGNFTGYEQLYGRPTANMMQQFWAGSNPELAYNTGVIDAARYRAITGRMEPDYVPPVPVNNGGGGGGAINADYWQNGRPVWTAAHGGVGGSSGSSGGSGGGGRVG